MSLDAAPTPPVDLETESERAPFMAFVSDADSEATLRTILTPTYEDVLIRRGGIRRAIRTLASQRTPKHLIVDVSGEDDPFDALNELAAVCLPDVKVIVLGDAPKISLYRRLTREMGVSDYVYKPLSREVVSRVITPLLTHEEIPPSRRGGRVIAVCGAKGGVGATSVAIGIARRISEIKGHVALLDLHLRGGSTALMLGAQVGTGLRTAVEDPERLDVLLLERIATPINERFHLVATDEPFATLPHATPEGIARLVELMRSRFTHIVVDVPNPPSAADRALLELARYVTIVLGPHVVDIKGTNATLGLMSNIAPTAHISLVLNRANSRGALSRSLITEGLGRPVDISIPDLPHILPRKANLGLMGSPKGLYTLRALAPLVHDILGVANTTRVARPLLNLWRRS